MRLRPSLATRPALLLVMVLACQGLAACGQKGALKHPPPPASAASAAAPK